MLTDRIEDPRSQPSHSQARRIGKKRRPVNVLDAGRGRLRGASAAHPRLLAAF